MDPNETLRQLRNLLNEVAAEKLDATTYYVIGLEFERARDMFHDLDKWICNGGFLPDEWQR